MTSVKEMENGYLSINRLNIFPYPTSVHFSLLKLPLWAYFAVDGKANAIHREVVISVADESGIIDSLWLVANVAELSDSMQCYNRVRYIL